jgi:sortase A
LAGVAVVLVLFVLYLFVGSSLLESRSQHLLADQLASSAGRTAFAGRLPADGQAVAVIAVPELGLHSIVVEGVSSGDLERGPGLLPGSAPPGTGGDTVIEGRRTAFGAPFADLPRLHEGETIQVVDALGEFSYDVTSVATLQAGSADPISTAPAGALTLVTSAPRLMPTQSLVVSAKLVGAPVAADPVAPPPDVTLGLGGDPGAGLGAYVSLQLLVAEVAGLWWWRRRRGQGRESNDAAVSPGDRPEARLPLAAWILAAPVTLALLLLLFGETARLLPSTL